MVALGWLHLGDDLLNLLPLHRFSGPFRTEPLLSDRAYPALEAQKNMEKAALVLGPGPGRDSRHLFALVLPSLLPQHRLGPLISEAIVRGVKNGGHVAQHGDLASH